MLSRSWGWSDTTVIPELRGLRQEDPKFQASAGYSVRFYFQNKNKSRPLLLYSSQQYRRKFKFWTWWKLHNSHSSKENLHDKAIVVLLSGPLAHICTLGWSSMSFQCLSFLSFQGMEELCGHHSVPTEVRKHPVQVGSLLLPCRSWALNSSHQLSGRCLYVRSRLISPPSSNLMLKWTLKTQL